MLLGSGNSEKKGDVKMAVNTPVRSQKRTFSLSGGLISALDQMVAEGFAPSKNALVERALINELRQFRRQQRATAWKAAAKDPKFMREVAILEEEFRSADQETLRRVS